ncbi:MAG TPA: hypothetical protein VGG04_09105 [Candidatus Sulfotelmatobacter sp.]|jgi:hypothetical protein
MRLVAAITLLAAITPWAGAQRMSGFAPHAGMPATPGFAGSGFRGPHFTGNGFGKSGFARSNREFPGALAIPFLSDDLYSDLLATGYPSASQPPVLVMQAPPTASPSVAFPAPKDALMIELQGGRYVQISGEGSSGAESLSLKSASSPKAALPPVDIVARASEKATLRATLVYRDGHSEAVSDYTITNGAIYANADYYQSGAWNRRIELSSLNLPETVQLNQARGLNFQLPSSPNEVVVGP